MFRNIKVLLIALAVLVLAGGAYGFAAANTIEDNAAGYLATVVSGYDIEDIVYDLNVTDPTVVDKIIFSVSPTDDSVVAAIVKVQTVNAGAWTNCVLTAGTPPAMTATCTFTDLDLADITALNIVASSSTDPAP